MSPRISLFAASVLLCINLHAQSLGDVAREQQHKKKQEQASTSNSAPKKVLTNDDMPASPSPRESDVSRLSSANKGTISGKPAGTWSAEKFKAEIQKRKDAIAATQEAIDKIEPSINYVQNNRNIYTNAPEYNAHQDEKQRAVGQLKGRLADQKSELEDLQEQARQAGYGSAVYQ